MMSKYQRQKLDTIKFGMVSILRLSPDQIVELNRLAGKWDCESLAEAAEEILRDFLDESSAKRQAKGSADDVQNRE